MSIEHFMLMYIICDITKVYTVRKPRWKTTRAVGKTKIDPVGVNSWYLVGDEELESPTSSTSMTRSSQLS